MANPNKRRNKGRKSVVTQQKQENTEVQNEEVTEVVEETVEAPSVEQTTTSESAETTTGETGEEDGSDDSDVVLTSGEDEAVTETERGSAPSIVQVDEAAYIQTDEVKEEPEEAVTEKPVNLLVESFKAYHEVMGRHIAPTPDQVVTAQYSLEAALVATFLVEPSEEATKNIRDVLEYTRTEKDFTFSEARMSRRISYLHAKNPGKRRRMSALMHILARLSKEGRDFKVSLANLSMMLGSEQEAQNLRLNCNRALSMNIC